jgi:hypothetical protein
MNITHFKTGIAAFPLAFGSWCAVAHDIKLGYNRRPVCLALCTEWSGRCYRYGCRDC